MKTFKQYLTESVNDQIDHYNAVKSQHGFNTQWSKFDVPDLNAKHPYNSKAQIVYQGHKVPVKGNKWVDVYRAADEAMSMSNTHHSFIEKIVPKGNDLHLITGS